MAETFEHLKTNLQIASPDDFYQELMDLHEGLSDDDSQKLNAKLVLILSNHIGDSRVLAEALRCARNS